MRSRGPALGALVAVLAVSLLLGGLAARGRRTEPRTVIAVTIRADPNIGPFRGLGTWVDIYDRSAWANPRRAVEAMAAHGVRTLFLQTSNFARARAFVFAGGVARFVNAAHASGVRIVAWYLPGLADLSKDERRSLDAIRFVTPKGNAFDGFGLDIEAAVVRDPAARTRRLLALSDRLRAAAGEAYPLGAIIPSPRRIDIADPSYWPGFPYQQLAWIYDSILPMTYYTFRVSGMVAAHAYASSVIRLIRDDVGSDGVPIHVIGGIAVSSSTAETRGFVHAVRERGVIGASFYTFPGITDAQWHALHRISANPVEVPSLPVVMGPDALGNLPSGDRTHPKEVVYGARGMSGSWSISFQTYHAHDGNVRLYVNWRPLATATTSNGWASTRTVDIPEAMLNDASSNYIAFVAAGNEPDWTTWGVRDVQLLRTGSSPSPFGTAGSPR